MLAQQLSHATYEHSKLEAWKRIWSWEGVIPRIKLFLWKAVHGGVATLAELHRRVRTINPRCPRCDEENEFLNHCLFFCQLSRATWFSSDLALRVDHIPMDFAQAILELTTGMDLQHIQSLCNLIWGIWKARNEVIFQGKTPTVGSIIAQAKQLDPPPGITPRQNSQSAQGPRQVNIIPTNTEILIVDASWDVNKEAGWGAVWYDQRGSYAWAGAGYMQAEDPLHGEALALLHVTRWYVSCMSNSTTSRAQIFSDCKVLVQAIRNNSIDDLPSWKATPTVVDVINLINSVNDRVIVRHVSREALKGPHNLANWARRNKEHMEVLPREMMDARQGITTTLDDQFFCWEPGAGEG